jgi:NADPH:quinone reductase-like Zn-dependent oxidoreductase
MESTATLQNFFVGVKNGEYVGSVETIPAQAAAGHVLVKVGYSTCDPYDGICSELFKEKENFRLGGEGSGVIISVGEGADRSLLNKKVSFHAGAW